MTIPKDFANPPVMRLAMKPAERQRLVNFFFTIPLPRYKRNVYIKETLILCNMLKTEAIANSKFVRKSFYNSKRSHFITFKNDCRSLMP